MTEYEKFLDAKTHVGSRHGFKPIALPGELFDYQAILATWAIERGRAVVLWSNPGEVVFTPFMGVGSEVYGAVLNGRKGVGVELKTSYFNQAVRNCEAIARDQKTGTLDLQ